MTLPELLVVLMLVAIATALAGPKTLTLSRSATVASARMQLAAVAEAARASAIQRQRPATVLVSNRVGASGATLTASVDTGGAQPYVVQRLTVGTNVTARVLADTLVTYDARGMIAPRRTPPTPIIYLLGLTAGAKDSVCLSPYGHVLPRACVL